MSKKSQSICEEEWKQVTEFTVMLTKVAKLPDADVEGLKKFLKFFCHPHTYQQYVDIKLYEHSSSPAEIIEVLFPRYIHYMHTDFLRQIMNKFGNEQAKTLLKRYEDNFPRKKPLKQMCNPLSDEEINAFTGTKRIKIKLDGDANIDTGVDESMIVYAKQTPSSSETSSWDGELALCNYDYPLVMKSARKLTDIACTV